VFGSEGKIFICTFNPVCKPTPLTSIGAFKVFWLRIDTHPVYKNQKTKQTQQLLQEATRIIDKH